MALRFQKVSARRRPRLIGSPCLRASIASPFPPPSPLFRRARHPQLHFRGLLSLTRVTVRWIAQPQTGVLCHQAYPASRRPSHS
jgi:hypothetical protein